MCFTASAHLDYTTIRREADTNRLRSLKAGEPGEPRACARNVVLHWEFLILHGLCAVRTASIKTAFAAGPLGEFTHYSIHQPLIATRYLILITLKATNF